MLSEHEQRLVERDRQLPGIPTLLDADRILEMLAAHRTGEFDGLRLMYLRYKPHINLLAGYGRNGVVECYAKTFRLSDHVKLRKAHEKAATDSTGRSTRIVNEDSSVVVSVFPADAKLRVLAKLTTEKEMRRLARLAGTRTRHSSLQSLRYKPERRFVAKLIDKQGVAACVKVYTGRGLDRALAGSMAIAEEDSIPTPRFLGTLDRLHTVAYEWLDGPTLHHVLEGSAADEAELDMVGPVLARLHRRSPVGLPKYCPADVASATDAARREVLALLPEREKQLEWLCRMADTVTAGLDAPAQFLHGDFNAEQVITTHGDVHLIDFDRAAAGTADIDVATFAAHLEMDAIFGKLDAILAERLQQQLTAAYLRAGGQLAADPASVTAVVLLQLSSTPFRRGRKDWGEQIGRILDRCETLFRSGTKNVSGSTRVDALVAAHSPALGGSKSAVSAATDSPISATADSPASRAADSPISVAADSPISVATDSPVSVAADSRVSLTADSSRPAADAASAESFLLKRALDEDFMAGQLRQLADLTGISGTPTDLASAHLLKRRAGKRFVVEYRGVDGDSSVIGKVRVKGIDKRSFKVTRRFHELGFSADGGRPFAVPEPVGEVPELNMCLFRKAGNTSAQHVMKPDDRTDTAQRIGRAVAELHAVRPLTDRQHTVNDEMKILANYLMRFVGSRPQLASRIDGILEDCRQLFADLPHPLCGIHRDFYHGNVIVDAHRVFLIDLDLYAVGDPAIDAGNFVGHVVELAIRRYGQENALDHVIEEFWRGYEEHGGPADYERARNFATLTIARHIYLSTIKPGREVATEHLINACERRLGDARARTHPVSNAYPYIPLK